MPQDNVLVQTICMKEAGDLLQINSESENRYIARLLPQNLGMKTPI